MCYVIELIDKYIKSDYLAITIEKKEGIKMDYVIWRMMSDHNYLQVITDWMFDFMPFKFISKFGDSMIDKIATVQSLRYPLKCKMYTPDYISEQQCLVNEFLDKDFSPCPVKCVPIQREVLDMSFPIFPLILRTVTIWKMKFATVDQLFETVGSNFRRYLQEYLTIKPLLIAEEKNNFLKTRKQERI